MEETWLGVEFDAPIGPRDGSIDGEHYFQCAPRHGGFYALASGAVKV